MFEKNILTFNPGWDGNAAKLSLFTDVREISFILGDPDGNTILVDQHV
jgi:hypothetical protein